MFVAIRPISILFICARIHSIAVDAVVPTRVYRFQYEIPTVGQHYGNAFHLGEDDEEVSDLFIEHHHLTETDVQTIMEEHIAEDDDDVSLTNKWLKHGT